MMKSAARFPLAIGGFLRRFKCDHVRCILLVHAFFLIFLFGYWVGLNESRQKADCINTLIHVETTWDGKKWNHSPVIRCLKPGEKK